jgi:mannose-6-phosphate isomerase
MNAARPFLLQNTIQHYEWGARNADAFIAKLAGIPVEPDVPYAELWIGTHPKAPSSVATDGDVVPLTSFIEQSPTEVLGAAAAEKFSSHLPFLLKVLSAAEPLSIQAHPNKAQARVLHTRDPLNYPDENHKPEIAIALDELTALAGFKPFIALAATLEHYPALANAAGADAADAVRASATYGSSGSIAEAIDRERAALKNFYRSLMTATTADPAMLDRTIEGIVGQMRRDAPTEESSLFLKTLERYPADVGVLSILLLNIVHLRSGEGIFIGAGIPHAYLRGNIVECMANSDNVVRAGLTPKFKDVETLCNILTYDCGMPHILRPASHGRAGEYRTPVAEFSVTRRRMGKSEHMHRSGRCGIEIALVTDGAVTLTWNKGRAMYKRGDAVLLPAALSAYEIRSESDTELFTVSIP